MRSSPRSVLLQIASRFARNRPVQSLLETCVAAAQYLQGIGAGANISFSGEKAVLQKLRPSSVRPLCIFDVGANTGQFVKLASEVLHDRDVRIHSFEPGAQAFNQLQQTARTYSNVIANNFALGEEPEERDLFYDVPGSQLAALSKRRLAHHGIQMTLSEKVKVETLDRYCADRRIEQIDLLKLDVEGHELAVMHGAAHMFASNRIEMVTFEFGGCNIDTRTFVQDFFYFFREHGMRMARITPGGSFFELATYSEILEQFRTTNYLCYRV